MNGYQYNFYDDLIVDHFCGGGGASTGIELALGRIVDIAVNHDINAIRQHEVNHPYTKHYLKDVFEVDPREAVGGRKIMLMWLSPDCTHFSKAKGGTPVRKEIRGLAWLAVKWAAAVKPRVIMLENVPEFVTWGPIKDGHPIKEKQGQTFKKFVGQLKKLGYAVEWRTLCADDYGAATSRKRLVLIARSDGKPIVWPKPTHGDGKGLLPKRPAADFIDFTHRGKSIFDRKKPLATATIERIVRGLDKFTIKSKKPFIIPIGYGERKGQAPRVNDIDKPLGTIVTAVKHNLVAPKLAPYVMCNNNANIGTAADTPLHTITTGNRHFLTEAALMPFVGSRYGKRTGEAARGKEINAPLPTITAARDHNDLIAAHITKYYSGPYQAGSPADAPLDTITAVDHNALVESHLCVFRRNMDCKPVDEPLPTITAAADHFSLVNTYLLKYDPAADLKFWPRIREMLNTYAGYSIADDEVLILEIDGVQYYIADIEMRMLEPRELYGCQGFPSDYVIDRGADGTPLTKTEQIRKVGNSVSPQMSAAVVRANFPEYATKRPIGTMEQFYKEVSA